MKIRSVIMAAIFAVGSASVANALDRDAGVIGQVRGDFTSYKDTESALVTVWDETALDFEREWAVVAGLGAGKFLSSGDSPTLWFAALGTKWYPHPTTGLQLLGSIESGDSGDAFRLIGASASIEQHFIVRQSAISPFLTASASVQSTKIGPLGTGNDSFTCLVFKAGVGCDLILHDDVTLVVNVAFVDSQSLSSRGNGDYADGWNGGLAMKYYWF